MSVVRPDRQCAIPSRRTNVGRKDAAYRVATAANLTMDAGSSNELGTATPSRFHSIPERDFLEYGGISF